MRSSVRVVGAVLISILLVLTLNACGGGGGGGGGGSSSGGAGTLSYTGFTTQTSITAANAPEITATAYKGTNSVASVTGIGVVYSEEENVVGRPLPMVFVRALAEAIYEVDFSLAHIAAEGVVSCDSITEPGPSSGSATMSICYDDVSGSFSGSMIFNGYTGFGITMSGGMNISGELNPNTGDLIQFGVSFNAITVAGYGSSVTIGGDLAYNFTNPSMVTTTSNVLLFRDNNTSEVFKFENTQISITLGANYYLASMSSRIYAPKYGYAYVSTPTPIGIYVTDDAPYQGVVLVTGKTGLAGGPTMARLTVISTQTCRVEADTDGNGTWDYDSGPLSWTELYEL